MIFTVFAALAALQQPIPAGVPPAPPPPPLATTPSVQAAIKEGEACFDERWDVARERRFAAERLVRPLSAPLNSPEWVTARASVLALVTARRELSQCVKTMSRSASAVTDADRIALDYWTRSMMMDISSQAIYETGLLIGLIDRSFANPTLGNAPGH